MHRFSTSHSVILIILKKPFIHYAGNIFSKSMCSFRLSDPKIRLLLDFQNTGVFLNAVCICLFSSNSLRKGFPFEYMLWKIFQVKTIPVLSWGDVVNIPVTQIKGGPCVPGML